VAKGGKLKDLGDYEGELKGISKGPLRGGVCAAEGGGGDQRQRDMVGGTQLQGEMDIAAAEDTSGQGGSRASVERVRRGLVHDKKVGERTSDGGPA